SFISANHPGMTLEDGYQKFLNDLERSDPNAWAIDTSAVLLMGKKLKTAFHEQYEEDRANFTLDSKIMTCLLEANPSKFKNFKEHKLIVGEIGPNILGSAMKVSRTNPNE